MALWSDIAPWRGPSPNITKGGMREQRGLVVHIASGFYEGTISWQRNPEADVSSHFVVGRAGEICQMVDTSDAAWTQRDGNGEWLSVECEGFGVDDPLHDDYPGWERLTDAQLDNIAKILERGNQVYGYPLSLASHPNHMGLGYHSMGAENGYNWGHSQCPGEPVKAQLQSILDRVLGNDRFVEDHDMGMLAQDNLGDGTIYACFGWRSYPINPARLDDIKYLAKQGAYMLAQRPAEGSSDAEWDGSGWIRQGWSPEVFGPVDPNEF